MRILKEITRLKLDYLTICLANLYSPSQNSLSFHNIFCKIHFEKVLVNTGIGTIAFTSNCSRSIMNFFLFFFFRITGLTPEGCQTCSFPCFLLSYSLPLGFVSKMSLSSSNLVPINCLKSVTIIKMKIGIVVC